jgi:hypothetical protein
MLFLQRGKLTFAVAVFGADSSRAPGSPAPVGCCRYYRSAQLAPTHPGSASPCFPAQGSPGLPVTQYSSVRSCYPPSNQSKYDCRREQAQLLLSPLASVPFSSAGFLRVLVTHCLLCEKRRVDLLQVREQRSSQPPWLPPSSVPSSAHWNPSPRAVQLVLLNCAAGGISMVNP